MVKRFLPLVVLLFLIACAPAPEESGSSTESDPSTESSSGVEAAKTPPGSPEAPAPAESSAASPGDLSLFANAAEALLARPSGFDAYVFYLHGRILEEAGRRPTHPEYGVYEYDQILQALALPDVALISEVRASGTDPAVYAKEISSQIRELFASGVAPAAITVIGFSKGGVIALQVSDRLAHDEVGFVILAACGPWLDSKDLRLHGRLLSIFESSDDVGSCRPWLEAQSNLFFHEVEVTLGGSHGAFYRPDPAWVDQTLVWTGAPALQQQMSQPELVDRG